MLPEPHTDSAAAFELLWAERQSLSALMGSYRIPPSDQEDLLQESFVVFLRTRGSVANPGAFLRGVTRNLCRGYWRLRRRRLYDAVDTAALEAFSATSGSPEEKTLRSEIGAAIGHLPDRCKALLRLRYREGIEGHQLAGKLGYRVSGIRKVAERCLGALVRKLTAPRRLARQC
jgi:RNA polymerase sigma factor (sigma-70 family)